MFHAYLPAHVRAKLKRGGKRLDIRLDTQPEAGSSVRPVEIQLSARRHVCAGQGVCDAVQD